MTLFTKEQIKQLQANDRALRRAGHPNGAARAVKPVAKLFTPDAQCTWLLTELHRDGLLFGLCDLGLGAPELGFVSMAELVETRGPLGLPIERDRHFVATKTLAAYADEARACGSIVT